MCHRKLTFGKKKKDMFFGQSHNFPVNNRVSWSLLSTSKLGACCLSSGSPSAAGFTEAASSSPETRQPFSLEQKM